MANLPLEQIKELYYKEGLTAQQVGSKLGTTSSTIYKFMRKEGLSRRSFQQINKKRFDEKPLSFNSKRRLTDKEQILQATGIMLYWGEGTKKGHNVEFSNSDPRMVQVFLRFLRDLHRIDESRLRVYLYCYGDQNIEGLKNYWSKATQIPLSQFTKPYIRKDFYRKNVREMKYGLAHIRYSDTKLLAHLKNLIEQYAQLWVGTQAVNGITL